MLNDIPHKHVLTFKFVNTEVTRNWILKREILIPVWEDGKAGLKIKLQIIHEG